MTVYFAEEIGTGRIKIGYTESCEPQLDRINGALTMTSHDLVVRAELCDAPRSLEQMLHETFARWRIQRSHPSDPYSKVDTEFFSPSWQLWSLIGYIEREHKLPFHPCQILDLDWYPKIREDKPETDEAEINALFNHAKGV